MAKKRPVKSRSTDVRIRRLDASDASLVREISRTFKGSARSDGELRTYLDNPANYFLVAEAGREVAGFLTAYRLERADRAAGQMFVYEVEVDRPARRRGVGSALLREIQEIARREGMFEAFVLTSRGNDAARKLYASTGGIVEDDAAVLFVYPLTADGASRPPGKKEAGK